MIRDDIHCNYFIFESSEIQKLTNELIQLFGLQKIIANKLSQLNKVHYSHPPITSTPQ